ncbi:MAG: M1 family aminopeptidase [bacterium]|nr:M1 family aminopeptidase [bacterium]
MTRALILLFVAVAILSPERSIAQDDYWQQFVYYTIRTSLDTGNHMLTGTETISYTNNSPDTLTQFYLHLYPNAYRSKNTAFMRDYRRRFNINLVDLPGKYRGYLDISNVKIDGQVVNARSHDTITQMDLPRPLLPGGTMEISLEFESKIRRHLGRSGYDGDHYDMAQWYPKVVVYDEKGWHPDLFMTGEFYGEFGVFDVYIDVPEHYVVVATGVLQSGDAGWDLNSVDGSRKSSAQRGKPHKTVHFHAENVHDFAWCADPKFVMQSTTVRDIEVRSFYRRGNDAWKDSTLAHAVRSLVWLEDKVGPYPYPQVSVVEGLLSGGLESPMLVMDGRVDEALVVHEIGHIYFYGILANDERNEAWLDVGFTTFQTKWYEMSKHGEDGIPGGLNWYQKFTPHYSELGKLRRRVFWLQRRGYGERIATRSELFENDYYTHVYRKAALMFFALKYTVGEDTFERILREYYTQWQLKHVNEERFQAVCEEVSGMDLDLFFEQWLHTTKISDYELAAVDTRPSERGDGYITEVRIERTGEMIMPVQLEFEFEDGTRQTARVEGRLRTIRETFEFPERPKKVALNSNNEIMDIKLEDNFIPRRKRVHINWPNNNYYPEDAYRIGWHPTLWYNDVDGAKTGIHVKGSYAGWMARTSFALYYGWDSRRLDFSASYVKHKKILGNNGFWKVGGYKMEGRNDVTLEMAYRIRRHLLVPPSHDVRFGLNWHELTNMAYIENPETYQRGTEFMPFIWYRANPQLDFMATDLRTGFRFGSPWFGGKFQYATFWTDFSGETRQDIIPLQVGLRMFLGWGDPDAPRQRKYYIGNGGSLAQDLRFWLRSPGAIWNGAKYHEPGHGNLRGYNTGSFGVNRLITFNAKLGRRFPFIMNDPKKLLGSVNLQIFADVGWIFDNSNPIPGSQRIQNLVDNGILDATLADAGFGFTWHKMVPFWDFYSRFEFPIYVSQPAVNGETVKTQYRFIWSLTGVWGSKGLPKR